MVASFERIGQSQKPAISSLVPEQGPSITVRNVPEKRARTLRTGVQASTPRHHSRMHQFLVIAAHLFEDLLVRHRVCFRWPMAQGR